MGAAGGANIANDGLVFAYDTGNAVRSYRGEPTINYIAHQNAIPQSSYTTYSATDSGAWNTNHPNAIRAYNIDGGDITGYINTGVGDWTNTHHAHWQYDSELGKPVTVMNCFDGNWKAKSFGTGMEAWSTYGMNAGDQYTISWLQWTNNLTKRANVGFYSKTTSGGNGFHDGTSDGSTTSTNTKTHTWERVYHTYTISSARDLTNSYGSVYMYGHYFVNGAPTILKIADVQLELKNHVTPYTGVTAGTGGRTTRSSTQGLLDMTGNSTIDLSNVSFNSNSQITFDGTDDEINTGITTQLTDFSCEVVFKNDNSAAWGRLVDKSYTNGFFISSYFGTYGVGYVGAGIIEPNPPHGQALQYDTSKYNHFVVTRSGTTHTIYLNGSTNSVSKTGSSAALGTAEMAIGAWYGSTSSQRHTGEIPVVRLYNQALTADEVQQNFQGIKNRFNI